MIIKILEKIKEKNNSNICVNIFVKEPLPFLTFKYPVIDKLV